MNAIHHHVRTYLHSDIHIRGLAFALQSAPTLHVAHCVAILKHGCIIFSRKSSAEHLSVDPQCMFFPIPSLCTCYQSYKLRPCLVLLSRLHHGGLVRYQAAMTDVMAPEEHCGKKPAAVLK